VIIAELKSRAYERVQRIQQLSERSLLLVYSFKSERLIG